MTKDAQRVFDRKIWYKFEDRFIKIIMLNSDLKRDNQYYEHKVFMQDNVRASVYSIVKGYIRD